MLIIPNVSDQELDNPSHKYIPNWNIIPDKFKNEETEWNKLAIHMIYHGANQLNLLQAKGANIIKTFRVIYETLASPTLDYHIKIVSVAFMLSEWFTDFWIDGDTHSRIFKKSLEKDL